MRLMVEIERRFGVRLPLATLLHEPTARGLARVIAGPRPPGSPASTLVPIQRRGRLLPFFCVHGRGGNVLGFRDLARALGPARPFYALQSIAVADGRPPDRRVEEMAARYLDDLRVVRPSGPYALGGYSFGGLVAWEMARRLAAAGERVALLALLDTRSPSLGRGAPPFVTTAWVKRRGQLLALDCVVAGIGGPTGQPGFRLRRMNVGISPGISMEHEVAVERASLAAANAYRPGPYAGRVILFRTRGATAALEPTAGWGTLATGRFEIRDLGGDHSTLLARPWVERLAAGINRSLARA
jgi:thioesterase domain-containing protein